MTLNDLIREVSLAQRRGDWTKVRLLQRQIADLRDRPTRNDEAGVAKPRDPNNPK